MRRSTRSPRRVRRGAGARGGAVASASSAPPSGARSDRRPASARRPARDRRTASHARALLTVDIGNSEITVGVFEGTTLAGFWRLTSARMTADEVSLQLDGLLALRSGARAPSRDRDGDHGAGAPPVAVSGGVVCSVVPALTHAWVEAMERRTGRAALEVDAQSAGSLAIRYHDKSAVGADRIANAIAVRALYGTPAIVVDLGTATTFDCVSRQGAYLGGVIAPGLGTSSEELFRRAARIPRVELRKPEKALGRTTEESLRAGVVWGHAGQIDALVRRLALEMKGTPHVIATGGYASLVAPECETINRVDEALTLKGMQILWQENR